MKEQDLKDLGFKINYVSEQESGDEAFHYYTLEFGDQLSLISPANTEVDKNNWYVEFFDFQEVRFFGKRDLTALINLLNRNKV